MAIARYACQAYASLEINRASFLKTGMIVSQTLLGEDYTELVPAENGMWVDADKGNLAINPVSADTTTIGIIYTSEKEYDPWNVGLKNFGRHKEGDYPRVGILSLGDTFTTNCFCYNTVEFANLAAVNAALALIGTTPLYLIPTAGEMAPQLTATPPVTGAYARVIKFYTVPNGEAGIKYNMVKI